MKKLLILLSLFTCYAAHAQKVTGYWYGQANVEMAGIQNNYLTELIIAQKGNKVKGFFGYYFKDVYQSFMVKGTFDPQTKKVVIRNIPIIYFATNSTAASVDCITNFYGTLMVSKVKSSLTGYFVRDKKYTYTCPDLRVSYTLFKEALVEDSVFKDMVATHQFWKSHSDEYIADASASTAAKKEETAAASAKKAEKIPEPVKDKAAGDNVPDIAVAPSIVTTSVVSTAPVIRPDLIKISEQFKKRKQVLGKVLEVASDSVRVSFYDNAEIDGDSISVFLNGNLIAAHQELSERAINLYVKLDSTKETNELSMFAENLGKYPPNTALMVVSDGEQRYETFLSSDFKGNATVRFKRKKSE